MTKSRRGTLREFVTRVRRDGFAVVEVGDEFFSQIARDLAVADSKALHAEEMRKQRSVAVRQPVRQLAGELLNARPGLTEKEVRVLVERRWSAEKRPLPDKSVLRDEIRAACVEGAIVVLKSPFSSTTLSTNV